MYNSVKTVQKALTFDDVLLIPQYSEIGSRAEVDLTTDFLGQKFKIPIISANMDTITGYIMADVMSSLGGLGIIHRYMDVAGVISIIKTLAKSNKVIVPSIGVQKEDISKAEQYLAAGATAICIDVAHGDSKTMYDTIKALSPNVNIIAGNVATYDAALRMCDVGVNVIKVGIGPGSMCSTRVVTGHGMPQVSAISEVSRIKRIHHGVRIIADGGIRNSGDIVKALAFGADTVMLGSLLAGTDETPGDTTVSGNVVFRSYRGMASREAQEAFRGKVNNNAPEGESTRIRSRGPVKDVIEQLLGGVRSGLSYSGAFNLRELREQAEYVIVSQAGYLEGTPHGKGIL